MNLPEVLVLASVLMLLAMFIYVALPVGAIAGLAVLAARCRPFIVNAVVVAVNMAVCGCVYWGVKYAQTPAVIEGDTIYTYRTQGWLNLVIAVLGLIVFVAIYLWRAIALERRRIAIAS